MNSLTRAATAHDQLANGRQTLSYRIMEGLPVIRPRPGRELSDPLMDTHLVVHSPEFAFVAGQPD